MAVDTAGWQIDPQHTLIVHFSWPNQVIDVRALAWLLERFPRESVRTTGDRNYVIARNKAVRRVLCEPDHYRDFLFLDADMTPAGAGADPFLCVDADVVACVHPLINKLGWAFPDSFHSGMWRCKRKVLETLKPPWFMRRYTVDGCDFDGCDCQYFREKVQAAGFSVAHAGWADHDTTVTMPEPRYCGLIGD